MLYINTTTQILFEGYWVCILDLGNLFGVYWRSQSSIPNPPPPPQRNYTPPPKEIIPPPRNGGGLGTMGNPQHHVFLVIKICPIQC